jgi:hypothetical protein
LAIKLLRRFLHFSPASSSGWRSSADICGAIGLQEPYEKPPRDHFGADGLQLFHCRSDNQDKEEHTMEHSLKRRCWIGDSSLESWPWQ